MPDAMRGALESSPRVARKLICGLDTEPARRVVVIRARGPLDASAVEIELHYAQLKAIAAQLIAQEAEGERAALAAGVRPTPATSPPT